MGKLHLTADQPDDPAVQLAAKNTIKKYTITMHVSGTVHQPKISFESSPSFSEENIITLLFPDLKKVRCYIAMPYIVMMHLESLLFGSTEHSSKAQQFFNTLLKPLRMYALSQRCKDQTRAARVLLRWISRIGYERRRKII